MALGIAAPARADEPDAVARWRSEIAEASGRFGVPATWIERVMRAESRGRTTLGGRPITSRAGAMGLMQLMPGTWADLRQRLGLGADPYAPRDNILAGTAYLRQMYDRFGYPGLFGAYNAGPARYAASLASGRPLPAETQAYIAYVAGPRGANEEVAVGTDTQADLQAGGQGSALRRPGATPARQTIFVVHGSLGTGGDRNAQASVDRSDATQADALFVVRKR